MLWILVIPRLVNVLANLPLQVVTAENARTDHSISLVEVCSDARIADAISVVVLIVFVIRSMVSASVIQEYRDGLAIIL